MCGVCPQQHVKKVLFILCSPSAGLMSGSEPCSCIHLAFVVLRTLAHVLNWPFYSYA